MLLFCRRQVQGVDRLDAAVGSQPEGLLQDCRCRHGSCGEADGSVHPQPAGVLADHGCRPCSPVKYAHLELLPCPLHFLLHFIPVSKRSVHLAAADQQCTAWQLLQQLQQDQMPPYAAQSSTLSPPAAKHDCTSSCSCLRLHTNCRHLQRS